jgi:excisionase family DNA binding protein
MGSVITVKEAAERLKVAPATIYTLCARGRLVHIRVGVGGRGTIRILEQDLSDFLKEATVRPEALARSRSRRRS